MKYIVLRIEDREVPIIFPDTLVHSMVADAIRDVFARERIESGKYDVSARSMRKFREGIRPVAAGDINLGFVTCSGKSSTLKVESRGRADDQMIETYDYFHGIVSSEYS